MFKFSMSRIAFAVALAVVACALVPAVLLAQNNPTIISQNTDVVGNVALMVQPLIAIAIKIGIVVLVGVGLWEGFQAGRGAGGSYVKAGISLVVAVLLLKPLALLDMLGLTDLTAILRPWITGR